METRYRIYDKEGKKIHCPRCNCAKMWVPRESPWCPDVMDYLCMHCSGDPKYDKFACAYMIGTEVYSRIAEVN